MKRELAGVSISPPMVDAVLFLLPEWRAVERIFGSSEPPADTRVYIRGESGERDGGGRVARSKVFLSEY